MKRYKEGFVLVEVVVVFAIVGGLIMLATSNIPGLQRRASLSSVVNTLVADMKSQQTKAMSSVVESGIVQPAYGVYFGLNEYVLFHGLGYIEGTPSNAVVTLPTRVTFSSVDLPDSSISFASRSGEVIGFNPQQRSVTIRQTDSGETKTLRMNKYGVVTSID